MPISDPLVMPFADELLACLEQEVAKVLNPPKYVQLRPGNVVDHLLSTYQDECCEGLAWVRPDGFFPSSSIFPLPDESPQPKGPLAWAVTLELGAVRCAPTTEETRIPTAAEWDATTRAVMDDAAAMRRALCCFIDLEPGRAKKVLIGQWQPLSVQGGCVGGIIPVTIRGPVCDCAEAGPSSS